MTIWNTMCSAGCFFFFFSWETGVTNEITETLQVVCPLSTDCTAQSKPHGGNVRTGQQMMSRVYILHTKFPDHPVVFL